MAAQRGGLLSEVLSADAMRRLRAAAGKARSGFLSLLVLVIGKQVQSSLSRSLLQLRPQTLDGPVALVSVNDLGMVLSVGGSCISR